MGTRLQAYGGVIETKHSKTESALKKALAKRVKEQCGMDFGDSANKWLKFLELDYKTGRKAVFYVPPVTGSIKLQCQMREEEIEKEVEEVVEEEVPIEDEEEKKEGKKE